MEKVINKVIKNLKVQRKSLILDLFEDSEKTKNSITFNFTASRMLEKLDFTLNILNSLLEYSKKHKK